MTLRNVEQIKTVGKTQYVPPEVFSSWSTEEQINYVTGQVQLGYVVKAASFTPVNLSSLNDILRFKYAAKENFAKEIQEQFELPDARVPEALQKALDDLLIVTETFRTTVRNSIGYQAETPPESFKVTDSFVITNKRIARVNETNSDHYLTANDFKKIFNRCLNTWKNGTELPSFRFRRSNGNAHTIDIRTDRVEIGCQRLWRYEAEAIAIELGFYGLPFSE